MKPEHPTHEQQNPQIVSRSNRSSKYICDILSNAFSLDDIIVELVRDLGIVNAEKKKQEINLPSL